MLREARSGFASLNCLESLTILFNVMPPMSSNTIYCRTGRGMPSPACWFRRTRCSRRSSATWISDSLKSGVFSRSPASWTTIMGRPNGSFAGAGRHFRYADDKWEASGGNVCARHVRVFCNASSANELVNL